MTDKKNEINASVPNRIPTRRRNFRSYLNSPIPTYQPWYDDKADYNTNAKSYYDYLARFNHFLKQVEDFINRLMDRDIEFTDSLSIDFTKTGDWIDNGKCEPNHYDDVIDVTASVIISKATELKTLVNTKLKSYNVPNGSKIKNDGLWSPDYFDILKDIDDVLGVILDEITNIYKRLDEIDDRLTKIENTLNSIGDQITNITNRITTLERALQQIINNLYESGAINNNTFDFTFNVGRNLATGNINFFGGAIDGNSFIRTNNGKTENDVGAGY